MYVWSLPTLRDKCPTANEGGDASLQLELSRFMTAGANGRGMAGLARETGPWDEAVLCMSLMVGQKEPGSMRLGRGYGMASWGYRVASVGISGIHGFW